MHIGFIEPHLKLVGGIRQVIEFGNRFIKKGHQVTYYLPKKVEQTCNWIECLGKIKPIEDSYEDKIDVLIFNEESQWFLMDRFNNVRLTVYYLLSYAVLYNKPESWASYCYPVDLYLACSNWVADNIEKEIGRKPIIIYGGINPNHFRPIKISKEYDVLCYGSQRPWKGTTDIEEACRILNLRLEKYEGKGISQEEMCYEYSKAKVFVVGSWAEGFAFPGLEALACGVPLVTTDCGGCREYAIHEETALIVSPRDPHAMAQAIDRLMKDKVLQKKLIRNGLEMARNDKFNWDLNAEIMLNLLEENLGEKSKIDKNTQIKQGGKTIVSPLEFTWDTAIKKMTKLFCESTPSLSYKPYNEEMVSFLVNELILTKQKTLKQDKEPKQHREEIPSINLFQGSLRHRMLLKYRQWRTKLLPLGTKRRAIYQCFIKPIRILRDIIPKRDASTSLSLSGSKGMEININRQEKLFEMINFAEEQRLYGITRDELMGRALKDKKFGVSTPTWIKQASPDRRTFIELVKNRTGKTVLDLGCGTGNFGRILEGKKVTGIDIQPERLEQARKQNVETICADLKDLSFLKGRRFDSAISHQVLEHLSLNDVIKVLEQLPEYIENNIIISVPSISSMPYTAYYDLAPDQICYSGHLTFWTPKLMYNLLSSIFSNAEIKVGEYAKYALFIEGGELYYHLWAEVIFKK